MDSLLNFSGTLITIFFGLWALVQPRKFSKGLSITPYKAMGITEIRTTYGGLILGLSFYTAIYQKEILYNCLGCAWLGAASVRIVSMFLIDSSYSKRNLIFALIEIVVGILLLI